MSWYSYKRLAGSLGRNHKRRRRRGRRSLRPFLPGSGFRRNRCQNRRRRDRRSLCLFLRCSGSRQNSFRRKGSTARRNPNLFLRCSGSRRNSFRRKRGKARRNPTLFLLGSGYRPSRLAQIHIPPNSKRRSPRLNPGLPKRILPGNTRHYCCPALHTMANMCRWDRLLKSNGSFPGFQKAQSKGRSRSCHPL